MLGSVETFEIVGPTPLGADKISQRCRLYDVR